MHELSKYTDEQLLDELKRRNVKIQNNTHNIIQYIEFDGVISEIDNVKRFCVRSKVKYRPFIYWKYKIKDSNSILAQQYTSKLYCLKPGVFKRHNAPQVGDRVRLRYRRRKNTDEYYDFSVAKIVEILRNE